MERRVYIIEIMPKWYELVAPELPDGRRCYYVGETAKELGERYREHLTGKSLAGRKPKRTQVFTRMRKEQGGGSLKKKVDLKLRRTMSDAYRPVRSKKAKTLNRKAKELESRVIDELRRQGHAVYPKGKESGSIPFQAHRRGERQVAE